jgi:WD40 repeat protein
MVFSPDGKCLATGSDDKTIKLWNVESQKEIATLEGKSSGIQSLAFSPDGKYLVSGGTIIKLWSVESKKEVNTLPGNGSNAVAFSRDGKYLATGEGSIVRLWSVEL